MTQFVAAADLDLGRYIRPGDHIIWSHACGEPLTLTETLVAQRAGLGGVNAFIGSAFSATLQPEHADHIIFSSMGAIGTLSRLTRANCLNVIPCHVGQIAGMIEAGIIPCDVAFLQLSRAGEDGRHGYGVTNDYSQAIAARARVVVAEINAAVPRTVCDQTLAADAIDIAVTTDRPVLELRAAEPTETDRAIAGFVCRYIEDGTTLQMGIGAVPEAVTRLIADRRDLGVHSGMIGDGIAALIEAGVVTNARKARDAGVTVTGALIGTKRLYDLAHDNPAIALRNSHATHGDAVLNGIRGLVTINSAIEVDLTGQVNAEQTGAHYLGGTGGQVDYVRAGSRARGGHSIIALPATAKGGEVSRITACLSGPVTTARAEIDVIITEFGVAELKGVGLGERARRLVAIAHPRFREELSRAAHDIARRGL
jgi:acetyl-CoA hydrolase